MLWHYYWANKVFRFAATEKNTVIRSQWHFIDRKISRQLVKLEFLFKLCNSARQIQVSVSCSSRINFPNKPIVMQFFTNTFWKIKRIFHQVYFTVFSLLAHNSGMVERQMSEFLTSPSLLSILTLSLVASLFEEILLVSYLSLVWTSLIAPAKKCCRDSWTREVETN